jgi:4-diphosphocytidyl-2-C-methyl-D-erythritol kinase
MFLQINRAMCIILYTYKTPIRVFTIGVINKKMDTIKCKAPAKINLGLDVVRKREDGYHEVSMIMQTIHLYDYLTITKTPKDVISLRTNLPYLPTNENNLVYKAANLLKTEFNIKQGIHINLEKNIPVAAGLAGGSTDAAATLMGMNQIFDLKLTTKELMERGVTLGADIPYCILGGTAISEGIGEILTPLPDVPACHVVLVKPDIHVSTKYVYEHLELQKITSHPDIMGIADAIRISDLTGITTRLENVLETVTINKYPIINELKEILLQAGAEASLMSGSGPTVFGLFKAKAQAEKACQSCRAHHSSHRVVLTEFCSRISQ